jgi:hypothetical protein
MSGLKTLSCILVLTAAPAAAVDFAADPQLRFFASCAGRLSALMEHQWNYDTTAVDQTTLHRSEMIDLVSAVMPSDAGRDVLLMRVEAKHAQARLLRRAVINRDPDDATWAQLRAEALMRDCTSVLLSQ